jgi:uncharacterized membrane protein YeaQ/YmgE (transglycosylase-associated protein family)
MVVTIIAWIVLGAIAGYIAKLLVPGDEGLGVVGTIVLGIIGAFAAGIVTWLITGDPAGAAGGGDVVNIPSIIVAVVGAVVVVFLARYVTKGRSTV